MNQHAALTLNGPTREIAGGRPLQRSEVILSRRTKMNLRRVLCLFGTLGFAWMPAAAEVSDKVILPPRMWMWAVFGVALGVALSLVRRWIGAVAATVCMLLGPMVGIATVHDEFVGPAILREAGTAYALHSYGSAATVMACAAMILLWGPRSRRGRATLSSERES